MPEDIPTSVMILRELGPMPLHELARKTAINMNCPLAYDDVDGVMRNSEKRGLVHITRQSDDIRHTVWAAS